MEVAELRKLIERLVSLSKESETVEFKEKEQHSDQKVRWLATKNLKFGC